MIKSFWDAVASGRGTRLRNTLLPGSPAAMLYAAYGVGCVRIALGIPGHVPLVGFDGEHHRNGEHGGFTRGVVAGAGAEHPFALQWREEPAGVGVTELLTVPGYPDGRLHAYYWWSGPDDGIRISRVPSPVADLDDVSRLLLTVGAPWQGLAVSARALASWHGLGADRGALSSAFPAALLAAAVHRLAAVRAGDKGLFREAAGQYRVVESQLRRVDARLRRLIP